MPLTREIIERYNYNDIFIETGTWHGEGVSLALSVGFKEIHTIENNSHLYGEACMTFKGDNRVHLWLDDSRHALDLILQDINEAVTFWLDAHDDNFNSPLLGELSIISTHKIKGHTILIDDVDDFEQYGWDIQTIKDQLMLLCPAYQITIIAAKRLILVAEIP